MKVYVVETGCYENRGVAGVYASPETAMAAHPLPREGNEGDPRRGSCERPGGWRLEEHQGTKWWDNGLDWDDAAEIREYEVQA